VSPALPAPTTAVKNNSTSEINLAIQESGYYDFDDGGIFDYMYGSDICQIQLAEI